MLDGHKAFRSTVFVDNDRDRLLGLAQFAQKLVKRFGLGHVRHLAHQFTRLLLGEEEHILSMDDPRRAVDRLRVRHHDLGSLLSNEFHKVITRVRKIEHGQFDARLHDLANLDLRHVQDLAHHDRLVRTESAVTMAEFEHRTHLVVGEIVRVPPLADRRSGDEVHNPSKDAADRGEDQVRDVHGMRREETDPSREVNRHRFGAHLAKDHDQHDADDAYERRHSLPTRLVQVC